MTAIDLPAPSLPLEGPPRKALPAMLRGARRRCPVCGQGALFSGYLRVAEHCGHCDEALHHHRADDGPAYLTILIIAHVFMPAVLIVYLAWRPSVPVMLVGFCVATIAAALALLPVIKGAVVGLQWARRMHGFGAGDPIPTPDEPQA